MSGGWVLGQMNGWGGVQSVIQIDGWVEVRWMGVIRMDGWDSGWLDG